MAIFDETKRLSSVFFFPEDKTDVFQTPGESKAGSW